MKMCSNYDKLKAGKVNYTIKKALLKTKLIQVAINSRLLH